MCNESLNTECHSTDSWNASCNSCSLSCPCCRWPAHRAEDSRQHATIVYPPSSQRLCKYTKWPAKFSPAGRSSGAGFVFQLTSVFPSLLWGWAVNKRFTQLLRGAQPLRSVALRSGRSLCVYTLWISASQLVEPQKKLFFSSSINRGPNVFHSTQICFTNW